MANKADEQAEQERSYVLTVRITPGGNTSLRRLAEREARTKADTVRLMLAFAAAHMPKGYTGE